MEVIQHIKHILFKAKEEKKVLEVRPLAAIREPSLY